MARQGSGTGAFDTGQWFETWMTENRRHPWAVKVRIQTPVVAGSKVSIVIGPHTRIRNELKCYEDPRYRAGYEVPVCLVRERLTAGTAYQLETALKLIERLQGLDFIEGLAYMVLLHLLLVDQLRAAEGKESVLRGMTWEATPFSPDLRWRAQRALLSSAAGSVAELLVSWTRYGMRLAQGFGRPEDGTAGRPTYLIIPPFWISKRDFAQYGGGRPSRVPIFVPSTTAPLARHLVGTLHAALDLGRTLDVSVAAPRNDEAAATQDDGVAPYTFQWDGEHWNIVFDGTQLPHLNDLKGMRVIHYLIEHKGEEYSVLDLCRRVLDTPDVTSDEQARGVASRRVSDDEEEREDGLRLSGRLESRLRRGEPEEHDRLKDQLEKRLAEAEEVREVGGQPSVQLQEEIEALQDRLAADFDRKGRPRWESGQSRKAQVRVNKLLDKAEERLGKHCPELRQHLHNAIRRDGAVYCYRPDREINWAV